MTKQAQKAKSDKKRSAADVTREFDKLKDLQQVSEKRKSFLLSQVGIKISGLALLRFDRHPISYIMLAFVTLANLLLVADRHQVD